MAMCQFMCFFLNKFFIESKEHLIASSSFHVELLASTIKFHFLYKLMLDLCYLRQNKQLDVEFHV